MVKVNANASLDESASASAVKTKTLVNHLALVTEELRVCKRKLDIYLEKLI